MKIPRTLTDRDQRNWAHISAAHHIIQQTTKMIVTKTALHEIREAMKPLDTADWVMQSLQDLKVRAKIPSDAVVICSFFWLDEGLQLADNFINRCADCQTPIQFRPEVQASRATKLCVFCGADRCLKTYWAEPNKSERSGKRGSKRKSPV